jgi:hypothetical protein
MEAHSLSGFLFTEGNSIVLPAKAGQAMIYSAKYI